MIDHDRTALTERQWVVRHQDVQYDSYHALRLAGCTAVGFSCCLLRRLGNRTETECWLTDDGRCPDFGFLFKLPLSVASQASTQLYTRRPVARAAGPVQAARPRPVAAGPARGRADGS
jgi:hypothetical protein